MTGVQTCALPIFDELWREMTVPDLEMVKIESGKLMIHTDDGVSKPGNFYCPSCKVEDFGSSREWVETFLKGEIYPAPKKAQP